MAFSSVFRQSIIVGRGRKEFWCSSYLELVLLFCAMDNLKTTRTCSLKLGEQLRDKDHSFFVRLLLRSVVKASEVKQIDLKGRPGYCRITLSTRAALERLLGAEVVVAGSQLNFLVGDGSVVLLHVFGVDEDLPLSTIAKSVQQFGAVIGEPRREKKTVDGCTFSTGTVFVQCLPSVAVPCTLPVLMGPSDEVNVDKDTPRLRVWHVGQLQTCYRCGSCDHRARDCQSQLYSDRVRSNDG